MIRRRHRDDRVRVLRASMTTVKFEVLTGHHRRQVYAVPLARFLMHHRPA